MTEEFVERFRLGERLSLQEHIDRCSRMEDEIREFFPALVAVERVDQAIDDRNESHSSPIAHFTPLERVGDYLIFREIGRSGAGIVYEAEQFSLGRQVALKVLPRSMKPDAIAQIRFRREARSAARLHHTNIVAVFEVGQDGEVIYYAMQSIQGQGLDTIVEELKRLRDASRGAGERAVRPSGDEPARPSAGPFAADHRSDHRAGEPIVARQIGEVEKAWKWARRRPAIAGLIVLAVTLTIVGSVVSLVFAMRANDKTDAASSTV